MQVKPVPGGRDTSGHQGCPTFCTAATANSSLLQSMHDANNASSHSASYPISLLWQPGTGGRAPIPPASNSLPLQTPSAFLAARCVRQAQARWVAELGCTERVSRFTARQLVTKVQSLSHCGSGQHFGRNSLPNAESLERLKERERVYSLNSPWASPSRWVPASCGRLEQAGSGMCRGQHEPARL